MKHKIKICHFVNIITGTTDGVYAHIRMLLGNMDKAKYEQIFIFHGGEKVENEISQLGIKVFVIDELNQTFSLPAFWKFYKIIKQENVDIIHTHLLKPYAIAGLSNLFLRKKLIYNYHGLFINNIYYNWIEKFIYWFAHYLINLLKLCDIAIVPSETSKNLLLTETSLFPKVSVYFNGFVSNGTNTTDKTIVSQIQELKNEYYIVGIIARIEIQKRIDYSLNILKELKRLKKNVFFVFFGDGPLEEEMIKLSYELGVTDRLKFFGFVESAKDYIKYFDILLFTSDWEGFPLTIWESMAAGVPVISTDVGGIEEILEVENCGMVYSKGDCFAAVNLILKLISNNKLWRKFSQNGKLAIDNKYNKTNFVIFFEKLYTELTTK